MVGNHVADIVEKYGEDNKDIPTALQTTLKIAEAMITLTWPERQSLFRVYHR